MTPRRKRRRQKPSLNGVEVKLRRARVHIEALDGELAKVFPKGTYVVRPEIYEKGRKHVYRAENPPRLDPMVSAMIGDCLHNLRSSLDHIAYQLAFVKTVRTQFPIEDRPPRKRFSQKRTLPKVSGGVSWDVRQAIESVQPYNRRNLHHGLALLRDLNNVDKHRTLVVGVGQTGGHITSGSGSGLPPEGPSVSTQFTRNPLEHGEVLVILTYDPPQEYADPNLKIIPVITFAEGIPRVAKHSVIGVLTDLAVHIEQDVLPAFRQFFD